MFYEVEIIFSKNSPSLSTHVFHLCVKSWIPFATTLCWSVRTFPAWRVSEPSCPQNGVLGVHRSGGQKCGSQRLRNRDCKENKWEQSAPRLQLAPLCADCCVIWRCHAAGGLDSTSCLAEPFDFVASTSLMSTHIAWRSTSSANLHCYCVEGMRLTGAPIILVELHSVAIKRVRKEILTAHHWKGKKYEVLLSYRTS